MANRRKSSRKRVFLALYDRYIPAIRGIARKLGQQDDELVKDLEQEGALALLLLDPSRATSNQDAWIRQALKNRMVDFLRRLNPQKYESLDMRLEAGEQLEHTGWELQLRRTTRSHTRSRLWLLDETQLLDDED